LVLLLTLSACGRAEQLSSGPASGPAGQREVRLEQTEDSSGLEQAEDSSGGGQQQTGTPVDPCSLFTSFEAQAVTGGPVANPQRDALPILLGMPMCNFRSGPGADPLYTLAIGVWSPASWATVPAPEGSERRGRSARQAFDGYKKFNDPFGLTAVDDVGADALWDDKLGTLLVLDADKVIGIAVSFSEPDAPDRRQVATEIFKTLLPRLPEAT
jgi:hypothetical protein